MFFETRLLILFKIFYPGTLSNLFLFHVVMTHFIFHSFVSPPNVIYEHLLHNIWTLNQLTSAHTLNESQYLGWVRSLSRFFCLHESWWSRQQIEQGPKTNGLHENCLGESISLIITIICVYRNHLVQAVVLLRSKCAICFAALTSTLRIVSGNLNFPELVDSI